MPFPSDGVCQNLSHRCRLEVRPTHRLISTQAGSVVASGLVVTAVDAAAAAMNVDSHWGFVAVAAAVASLLTAVITVALEPLVPSCAAPRLPVAEPVYSADAVYDQVRESTVLAVENAKHAVGMA